MREIKIVPSILSADFGHLADEVKAVCKAGADLIHVDVMDGHFVRNLTIGPPIVEAVAKASSCPLDVHLMITNAEDYLDTYLDAGADILTIHAEAVTHLHAAVQTITKRGKRACVSLNPATSLHAIDEILGDLDMVLIMTVNPGFGGQSFIESCIGKIKTLAKWRDERMLDFDIQVDGGIKTDNAARVVEAGANVLVSGSGIFGADDYASVIADMRARGQAARSRAV